MKTIKRFFLLLLCGAAVLALARWVVWPKGAGNGDQKTVPFVSPYDVPTASEQDSQRRTQANPGDAAAWRDLGNAQLKNRNFRAAERSYVKALAIDPARAETWSALGEARIQFQTAAGAHMPLGAAEAFRKALALQPRDPRARFYFAMEKDFAGQHDAAIGDWLALLREVPAGSDADESIRAAITASVSRNQKLIARAIHQAAEAQPKKATN